MSDTGYAVSRHDSDFTLSVPADLHRPADGGDGSLLVALHGQGMSPKRFARQVLPALPPGWSALIPQGPLPFEIRRPGSFKQGNAWYVYLGDDEGFVRSMQRTEAWLLDVIDRTVADAGLDPDRVSLLGFSQGGYLAAYVGVRHASRFRRLVVAGGRIKHEVLEDAARAAAADHPDFRVLDVHGADDPSVALEAVAASVEAIRSCGLTVDLRTYSTGHAVLRDPDCARDVAAWLAAR